jgi:transposase-like protein
MVRRLVGPSRITAHELARQVAVPQPTLSRWRREAATLRAVNPPKDEKPPVAEPKKWTFDEKLRVIAEARKLSDVQLGELLRREGLHDAQLRTWIAAVEGGLGGTKGEKRGATAGEKRRLAAAHKRVRELEKELRRKEKALAETAALLVLEKKLKALGWDDEDDGTTGSNDE